MMESLTNLGLTLKSWRAANRMTLGQLAEKCDLSISYLSDLENGRTLPSLKTLDILATAFNCELAIQFVPHKYAVTPSTATLSLNDVARLVNNLTDAIDILENAGVNRAAKMNLVTDTDEGGAA